jgi:hypothetical protein
MNPDGDCRIVFLKQPGSLPTQVRYPGDWWFDVQQAGYRPHLLDINYKWWATLELLMESLDCRVPTAREADAAPLPTWPMALGQLSRTSTFSDPSEYHCALSTIVAYTESITEAQAEFALSVVGGVTIRGVNYESIDSIVRFAQADSIYKESVKFVFQDESWKSSDIYLFQVSSNQDLLKAAVLASVVHGFAPGAQTCLFDHSYENFVLTPYLEKTGGASPLLDVFDSIIMDHEDRNKAVLQVARLRSRGLIRSNEEKEVRLSPSGMHNSQIDFPLLPTFAPYPVLMTRVSEKRCYWSKCTYCVQNNKYTDRHGPSRSSLGVFMNRLRTFVRAGYKFFIFSDEALSPGMLAELSERIAADNLPIFWCGRSKIERAFTQALAESLKRSGCFEILFGLETTDAEIQKRMNKFDPRIDEEETARVISTFRNAQISLHINLIAGFPGDSMAATTRTVDFVRRNLQGIPAPTTLLNKFAVFPETPVAANPDRFSIRLLPYQQNLPVSLPFEYLPDAETSNISREEIANLFEGLIALEEWGMLRREKYGEISRHMLSTGPHGVFFKARATGLIG